MFLSQNVFFYKHISFGDQARICFVNLEGGSNYACNMLTLVYLGFIHKVYTLGWGEEGLAQSIHLCLKLRNSYEVSILYGCPLPKMAFSYLKE